VGRGGEGSQVRREVEGFTEEYSGRPLEEVEVAGWEALDGEVPGPTELAEAGPMVGELVRAGLAGDLLDRCDCTGTCAMWERGEPRWPRRGVKVGGWVRWSQGVEYPECPDCGLLMTVPVVQLARGPVLGLEWGDAGTAHITACPACHRPGLGWACS
jgi:hypothetical protein